MSILQKRRRHSNLLIIPGIVFIFIGLLFMTNIVNLATILYPSKFWHSLYPDGTSTNPTMFTPSSTIQLKAILIYHDAQTGVRLPGSYATWIVTVTISELGKTVNLPGKEHIPSIENRYTGMLFEGSFNVPSDEGKSLTFNWLVILRDDNRNEYSRKSTTTYARTILDEPDGYFTVNGKKADEQTTHLVLEPTITVGFTPTKNAEKITRVYAEVWEGTSKVTTYDLTKSGTQYTKTYTLPGYGTYTFKGFYKWTGATTPIQKMSVVVGWEEGEVNGDGFPPGRYLNQIIGSVLLIVGIVCIVLPSKGKVRAR